MENGIKKGYDEKTIIKLIIENLFKNQITNEIKTNKCISYLNETRIKVNEIIHKRLYGSTKYFIGQ